MVVWNEAAVRLARSAAHGDADAVDELLALLRPRIVRSVRLIVGSGRPEAEDAAQEAMADIYRSITRLRSPESVVGWAFRIASRCAVRAARRERRLRVLRVTLDETAIDQSAPDEAALDAVVLRRAFNRLPARMRAVAVLRLYADFSEATVAEMLGCSVGTVKSQLHEARKRLAASISDSNNEIR